MLISQISRCWIERFLNFFFCFLFLLTTFLSNLNATTLLINYSQPFRMENKSWDLDIGQLDTPDSVYDYVGLRFLFCIIHH